MSEISKPRQISKKKKAEKAKEEAAERAAKVKAIELSKRRREDRRQKFITTLGAWGMNREQVDEGQETSK